MSLQALLDRKADFAAQRQLQTLPSPMQLRQIARTIAKLREQGVRAPMEQQTFPPSEPHQITEAPTSTIKRLTLEQVEERIGKPMSITLPTPAQIVEDEFKRAGPWIEHNGLSCPVPARTKVQVEYRNGTRSPAMSSAGWHHWYYGVPGVPSTHEIVRYRVLQATQVSVKTAWFPGTVPPARPGVYELWNDDPTIGRLFARFEPTGRWGCASRSFERAATTALKSMYPDPVQRTQAQHRWRGFTTPQE
jgi:hypothetical protein